MTAGDHYRDRGTGQGVGGQNMSGKDFLKIFGRGLLCELLEMRSGIVDEDGDGRAGDLFGGGHQIGGRIEASDVCRHKRGLSTEVSTFLEAEPPSSFHSGNPASLAFKSQRAMSMAPSARCVIPERPTQ